jgi:hypothetical protein
MFFFILILVALWGFNSDAPDWAKAFSWFMVLPIFIMTIFDMLT